MRIYSIGMLVIGIGFALIGSIGGGSIIAAFAFGSMNTADEDTWGTLSLLSAVLLVAGALLCRSAIVKQTDPDHNV